MLNDQYGAMRREEPSERERLLEAALDQVPYGVQIYDQDAHIVFFNRASKEQLLGIPLDQTLQGQALLDVFAVRPDYSTTMTALRRGKAMNRRFDRYKSTIGVELNTITSAYPVAGEDGETLGCVTFERNLKMTKRLLETGQQDQQTLLEHQPEVERSGPNTRYTLADLIGSSPGLVEAKELARKMAARDNNILIQGETGTGKEIFAQGIHNLSLRRRQKFVAVNCAAFPETLIEGMLFGTVKGAFTGSTDKVGLMEEANHGTLFLDELNSMSLTMQSKLLRVLQERTFRRVGGKKDLELDVRIISSCNEDPFQTVEENKFRRDLFYRLSTVIIELPPLREHLEDLEQLTQYHLEQTAFQYVHRITDIQPQVYQLLRAYRWPGNVRELFHVLDYAQNVADSNVMTVEHLPAYLRKNQAPAPRQSAAPALSAGIDFSHTSLQALMDDYEKQIITQTLDRCGYNISQTAHTLGILRQSLQYRIRKYGIIF